MKNRVFLAVVSVFAAICTSCGLLTPANSPRAVKFDCQEAALRPIFGELLDTKGLLRDLYTGNADLGAALRATGATEAEVKALIDALQACDVQATPADAADASSAAS